MHSYEIPNFLTPSSACSSPVVATGRRNTSTRFPSPGQGLPSRTVWSAAGLLARWVIAR